MPWRGLSWRRLAENGRKRAGWKLMYSSTPHFVRANPHNTRIFGLDKQNACPHNVFMSRSPSSIAVQSPIRTPCGSLPPGLSSKCPVSVQILFSLCPVSVQYLTSESEPPAMRLYEVDSFSSFRRRLRTRAAYSIPGSQKWVRVSPRLSLTPAPVAYTVPAGSNPVKAERR